MTHRIFIWADMDSHGTKMRRGPDDEFLAWVGFGMNLRELFFACMERFAGVLVLLYFLYWHAHELVQKLRVPLASTLNPPTHTE